MSRAALELEKAVQEMRAKERRGRRQQTSVKEASVEQKAEGNRNQLTGDNKSSMTDTTDLSRQEGALGGNEATGATEPTAEGKPTVAKKNAAKKAPKAPKTPKAAKAPKPAGEKKERKPRSKVVASGALQKVEATGTTYITLEFEEGKIVLTPTGNREQNRDIAAKALRALLKG